MLKRSFAGVAFGLLLSASTALGHHAFSAEFDPNRPITLDGTVTKVEWTNPHAFLYLDVTDHSGTTANWKVELANRHELAKEGWTETSLKVGQHVSMQGWQARNRSMLANADSITLDTGDTLSAASSYSAVAGTLAGNTVEPGAVEQGAIVSCEPPARCR